MVAITALAATGIPALVSTATADSIAAQIDAAPGLTANDVQLYNPGNVPVSTKRDGTDSTVRLEAGAGANVQQVRFGYRLTATSALTTVATVSRNDDSAFSYEWSPTSFPWSLATGTTLYSLNAQGLSNGQPIGASEFALGVRVLSTSSNVNTINLTAGSQRGYYDATDGSCQGGSMNVIAHGTSSVTSTSGADRPSIAFMSGSGNPVDLIFAEIVRSSPVAGNGTRWASTLDIAPPYVLAAPGQPNQIVVRAVTDKLSAPQPDIETQDYESYTLYKQRITSVEVSSGSDVTVTVLDQNGSPVADVQVRRGDEEQGTTNSLGQVYATNIDGGFSLPTRTATASSRLPRATSAPMVTRTKTAFRIAGKSRYKSANGSMIVDLPALGADPFHKDVFFRLDSAPGVTVSNGAETRLVNAFDAIPIDNPDEDQGINLHFVRGPQLSYATAESFKRLGRGRTRATPRCSPVPTGRRSGTTQRGSARVNQSVFHYAIAVDWREYTGTHGIADGFGGQLVAFNACVFPEALCPGRHSIKLRCSCTSSATTSAFGTAGQVTIRPTTRTISRS